jgi:hypothetical protein
MSIEHERVIAISERVIDSLQDDLVSVGELRQIIADTLAEKVAAPDFMTQLIRHLLAKGVEIGDARNIDVNYVKFIAWKGSITDRSERAFRQAECLDEVDRDYAFWLCLERNVDEYETR